MFDVKIYLTSRDNQIKFHKVTDDKCISSTWLLKKKIFNQPRRVFFSQRLKANYLFVYPFVYDLNFYFLEALVPVPVSIRNLYPMLNFGSSCSFATLCNYQKCQVIQTGLGILQFSISPADKPGTTVICCLINPWEEIINKKSSKTMRTT